LLKIEEQIAELIDSCELLPRFPYIYVLDQRYKTPSHLGDIELDGHSQFLIPPTSHLDNNHTMSVFNPLTTPLRPDTAFLSYQNTQREAPPSKLHPANNNDPATLSVNSSSHHEVSSFTHDEAFTKSEAPGHHLGLSELAAEANIQTLGIAGGAEGSQPSIEHSMHLQELL
jgi:hypothetical protein